MTIIGFQLQIQPYRLDDLTLHRVCIAVIHYTSYVSFQLSSQNIELDNMEVIQPLRFLISYCPLPKLRIFDNLARRCWLSFSGFTKYIAALIAFCTCSGLAL